MNKTKFLTVLVVLLLALNAVTLYFVWGKKDGEKRRPGNGGGRPYSEYISKKLNFDTVQKEQLKLLRDSHKLELDSLRKEEKTIQDVKTLLLKDGVTDSLKLDSVFTLAAANKKKFEMAFHKHFMEIRALCRPEQLELFTKMLDEMRKRRMPVPAPKDGPK
ncbi:periplasmic heavy metal sensor [Lacibacter luteus]|uniref:Periplasmic heavy metal sensor n=1 Tax=Lacibacter luteus TaxID=2508719 RepID=A0A4Q1CFG2_9BACT|nr:periplasmic heavy metal sensor [Lacibacter luteus]RXK58402.1 periplasmic heavy metal sensor [Lacibacter luteus]